MLELFYSLAAAMVGLCIYLYVTWDSVTIEDLMEADARPSLLERLLEKLDLRFEPVTDDDGFNMFQRDQFLPKAPDYTDPKDAMTYGDPLGFFTQDWRK